MSFLDTVFRRREPSVKYRTIDGGHPAPYPDMTDEQLYNYEMTFNVPKRTFDKRPGEATWRIAAACSERTEMHMREAEGANEQHSMASRTSRLRTGDTRTATVWRTSQPQSRAAHSSVAEQSPEPAKTGTREPVMKTQSLMPSAQLDLSKPVRTVTTKQPVEIITTRARHPVFKVLGYIGDDQVVTMFTFDGQISENGPRYLENVPQKQSLYLNIYLNRSIGGRERFFLTQHETKEAADAAATVERVACVPVEFDL